MVVPDFLSPLICEQQLNSLNKELVIAKLSELQAIIQSHYNVNISGIAGLSLNHIDTTSIPEIVCDNSELQVKWTQIYDRDFTGYIALNDYNDGTPFDKNTDVFGGKYEFPQHSFGFNPQCGTLIIHPSGPHFVHQHTKIEVGQLNYIKFYIKCDNYYIYDYKKFPGTFKNWFKV